MVRFDHQVDVSFDYISIGGTLKESNKLEILNTILTNPTNKNFSLILQSVGNVLNKLPPQIE